jgi:hypothetical protein
MWYLWILFDAYMIDALKTSYFYETLYGVEGIQGYGILTMHILSSQSRDLRRGMSYP